MLRRKILQSLAATLVLLGLSAAAALWSASPERLRHLAVPTLVDPSTSSAAAPTPIAERPACATRRLGRLPGRVGALLQTKAGQLWAGGFDTGVYLLNGDADGAAQLPGLRGRERFVNALVEHGGNIWAATYAGVLVLDPSGTRQRTHLVGIAVEALLEVDGALWAGTPQGVFRLAGSGAFESTGITGPDGEMLRVTALAVSGGRLWMGSPSGAYSVELGGSRARWHPLVFGTPGAETNVVLSLVPFGEGVVAGTDNGGLVQLTNKGGVRALRFSNPRANETNPGAAVARGGTAVFGTQGAGVLVLSGVGMSQPLGWKAPSVSALWAGARLLAGTDGGEVLEVTCPSL